MTLRQFITHSGLTLAQQILGAVCALLTSILLARALGPSGQGMYGLVISTAVLATHGASLGIPSASVYFVGSGHTPPGVAARQNTLLALLLASLGAAALAGSAPWLLPGLPPAAVGLGAALVFTLLFNNFMTSVLQGAHEFDLYNKAALAPPCLTLLGLCVLWALQKTDLVNALATALAAQVVTALMTFAAMRPHTTGLPWRLDGDYLKRAVRYGGMAALANAIATLNYRIDVYLITYALGTAAVGYYSVATGVGERLWLLSLATSVVLLPHAARTHEDNSPSLTPWVARHVLVLSAAGAGALYVLAALLIPWFFGATYAAAIPALHALLPGLVALNMARVVSNDLAGRGFPGLNASIGAAALALNIITNMMWIPAYGIVGAGWATSLSYTTQTIITVAAFCYKTGVPWYHVVFMQRSDARALRERVLGASSAV